MIETRGDVARILLDAGFENFSTDRISGQAVCAALSGAAFIDWFKKFYPDFIKRNVAYVCGAIKPPDTNFEEPV